MIGKPRIYLFSPTRLINSFFFYFSVAIVKDIWKVIVLLLDVALHFFASSANATGCTAKLSRNITIINDTNTLIIMTFKTIKYTCADLASFFRDGPTF